ncbi:MAG TPA: nuclear transport factor 2 family protein [Desulfuromonadaceae bacterium]|jgi:hypothetical protein
MKSLKVRQLTAVLISGCLAIPAGCGPSRVDERNVLQVLQSRVSALNQRNINLYMPLISANYHDKGKDLAQLKNALAAGFKIYEKIEYRPNEQNISIRGLKADVNGSYRMKVVIRGHEMVLDGKEHLELVKEPSGWKITAGL